MLFVLKSMENKYICIYICICLFWTEVEGDVPQCRAIYPFQPDIPDEKDLLLKENDIVIILEKMESGNSPFIYQSIVCLKGKGDMERMGILTDFVAHIICSGNSESKKLLTTYFSYQSLV